MSTRRSSGWRRRRPASRCAPPHATVPRAAGRPRHQRVPEPAAPGPAVHHPGVRLRPDDRAADRRAVGQHRLGVPRGIGDSNNQFHYTRPTADGRHPLGRLRGDLPLRQPDGSARSTATTPPTPCSPRTSSRPSRSSRACGSRMPGAGRSTPAPGSAPSGARRWAVAWPTAWATPASGSAPPASAPR